jgi:hypothetical protein
LRMVINHEQVILEMFLFAFETMHIRYQYHSVTDLSLKLYVQNLHWALDLECFASLGLLFRCFIVLNCRVLTMLSYYMLKVPYML